MKRYKRIDFIVSRFNFLNSFLSSSRVLHQKSLENPVSLDNGIDVSHYSIKNSTLNSMNL